MTRFGMIDHARLFDAVYQLLVFITSCHDFLQITVLFIEFHKSLHIGKYCRVGDQSLYLFEA